MALITDGKTTRDFKITDLPNIWQYESKQTWLIEGLIPENALVMLSGESGSGKSTVALMLADAVAKGEPFLGMPTQQRKVLICDRENGLPIYHERFERFAISENLDMHFWGHWCDLEPMGPASNIIEEFVVEHKPLLIFDSFISFNEGDEQDASQTRDYMDQYRRLTGLGATVILVHHTGKGENTKEYRGSSDIKASIDVGLVLTAKKPMLRLLNLRPFKVREGGVEPLSISFDGSKLVLVDTDFIPASDPDWGRVRAVVEANPGLNQGQIIKLLPEMPVFKTRKILLVGESTGYFRVEKGLKNSSLYHLGEAKNAQ